MSTREDFEKWKKEHSMNLEITIRDSNGDYQYIETRRDWYVWQNAIATRQPEIDALKADNASLYESLNAEAKERCRLEDENAALKAQVERLAEALAGVEFASAPPPQDREAAEDAERWRFHRDNKNFRYFRNSGVWEITGEDRSTLIEGRAATYQDAIDAAMKEAK